MAAYRRYAEVYDELYTSVITDYKLHADGVSETVFDNGVRILVNRTAQPVTVAGVTVEGLQYTIIR